MTHPRWTQRPDGSTWGDFGPDDQLGRVNLLTPEQVLKGVAEVKTGRTFCLSLPLDLPGGNALNARRHPPRHAATMQGEVPCINYPMANIDADSVDVLSDDQVLLSLQYSTQWDAFAHIGAVFDTDGSGIERKVYYNGYRAGIDVCGGPDDARDADGATAAASGDAATASDDMHAGHGCGGSHSAFGAHRLGIEHFAVHGMQGRGVLVDLARHFGLDRTLIGYEAWRSVLDKDGITIESGDMLVIRTGFAEVVTGMQGQPDPDALHHAAAVLDGRDEQLLNWITASGIAAICTDNYAVEAYPARPQPGRRSLLPLHHHCLFKLGLPLAELWYLRELADWLFENRRQRFLLTAPPLRLPGAVGSPVTPIATV